MFRGTLRFFWGFRVESLGTDKPSVRQSPSEPMTKSPLRRPPKLMRTSRGASPQAVGEGRLGSLPHDEGRSYQSESMSMLLPPIRPDIRFFPNDACTVVSTTRIQYSLLRSCRPSYRWVWVPHMPFLCSLFRCAWVREPSVVLSSRSHNIAYS